MIIKKEIWYLQDTNLNMRIPFVFVTLISGNSLLNIFILSWYSLCLVRAPPIKAWVGFNPRF